MSEIIEKDNINGTEIYVVDDVASVKDKLTDYIDGGLVAILYDVKLKEYADNLARCFRGGNHQVFLTCLKGEIPAYTRFVVGIGAGRVSREVREIATVLNIDCSLVFSAPTTDSILSPIIADKSHRAVFLDTNMIDSCPRECVASGWGIIWSEPLRNFEEFYKEKILDEKEDTDKNNVLCCGNDNINLAYCLLRLSSSRVCQDNATIMAGVILDSARRQGKKTRLMGEYRFISASVIATLYENYLSSPTLDCAIPPAHDKKIDALSKLTGRSIGNLQKAFDFFDIDRYFRVGYILSEYRLDLLEKLRSVDFHSAQKKWRRLYADAGYWLKSAFTTKTLLTAMKLSAEIGNGLLRYIVESGFAEAC